MMLKKSEELAMEQEKISATFGHLGILHDIFSREETIKAVVGKIDSAPTEEKMMEAWHVYHKYPVAIQTQWFVQMSVIERIRYLSNILRYFEIDFPPPPEIIRQAFFMEIILQQEEITLEEFDAFSAYCVSLSKIASMQGGEAEEKMRGIISATAVFRSRFVIESTEEKVRIIRQGMDVLKSFGIGFPSPPNMIKRFFLPTDEQATK